MVILSKFYKITLFYLEKIQFYSKIDKVRGKCLLMEKKYILFADTDSDWTPELCQKYDMQLISMPYKIVDTEVRPYVDFDTFDYKAYYNELRKGTIPTPSALSPANYVEYFEPFFKQGKDILYVHFSKAMSGTFNAMSIALRQLAEQYPDRKVYTIDTKGITVCSYAILLEVAQMYEQGKSIQEIMDWAAVEVDKYATYFFVNDLTFFKRSGRVKGVAAFMGNILGIRPIINMNQEGTMAPIGRARGLNGAIDKVMEIIDSLQEDIKSHRVVIAHTDVQDTVDLVVKRLKEKYGDDLNIEVHIVNPTAGAHCGPNGIGITFHGKHR